jgi:DegV family protein with EDD domain
MSVRIVTDSTANLTPEAIERYKLEIVTLYLVSNGKAEAEIDMDVAQYYRRLADLDTLPTSSQPSPEAFRKVFTRLLDEGHEVLGIFLSGALSGTVGTARMVAEQIRLQRPDARLSVVDSKSAAIALSYPVLAAAEAAEAGGDLRSCMVAATDCVERTRFIFAPRSLEYLRRGGRIGRASALLGSALKLVPVLGPENGAVYTWAKVRTFSKALLTIKDRFLKDISEAGGLCSVCIHYISDRQEAERFCKKIIEPLTELADSFKPISVQPVSPVVGTHVGPAVGLAYKTSLPLVPEGGESGGRLAAFKEKVGEYVHLRKEHE